MPTRRNYSSVFYDGRTRLQSYTPVTNFNGQSISKGLLDVVAFEMERLYDTGDYIYRAIDPTKAVGRELENIGFLFGERRQDSVNAADYTNTNFYFYIDTKINWSADRLIDEFYSAEEITLLTQNGYLSTNAASEYVIIIPAGTVVQNSDNSTSYTTLEAVTLDNANAYVGVISVAPGPDNNVEANVLINHTLQQIPELRKIARYIKCTNTFPIQNGSYSQSDDQYRYRITTKPSAFQGNELSIRRTALQVPGIRDILYEKNKFGSGTAHIIVDSVSPLSSEGLITAVEQATQSVASYGDIVFVSRPEYLGIEMNFSIKVEPGNADPLGLKNQVRAGIIQYINDLQIGGEIIWNQIVSNVLSVPGVVDFIPNYFKYGKYDIFNKINKEQVVLRFINQRARYNEKFYTDTGLITCCVA